MFVAVSNPPLGGCIPSLLGEDLPGMDVDSDSVRPELEAVRQALQSAVRDNRELFTIVESLSAETALPASPTAAPPKQPFFDNSETEVQRCGSQASGNKLNSETQLARGLTHALEELEAAKAEARHWQAAAEVATASQAVSEAKDQPAAATMLPQGDCPGMSKNQKQETQKNFKGVGTCPRTRQGLGIVGRLPRGRQKRTEWEAAVPVISCMAPDVKQLRKERDQARRRAWEAEKSAKGLEKALQALEKVAEGLRKDTDQLVERARRKAVKLEAAKAREVEDTLRQKILELKGRLVDCNAALATAKQEAEAGWKAAKAAEVAQRCAIRDALSDAKARDESNAKELRAARAAAQKEIQSLRVELWEARDAAAKQDASRLQEIAQAEKTHRSELGALRKSCHEASEAAAGAASREKDWQRRASAASEAAAAEQKRSAHFQQILMQTEEARDAAIEQAEALKAKLEEAQAGRREALGAARIEGRRQGMLEVDERLSKLAAEAAGLLEASQSSLEGLRGKHDETGLMFRERLNDLEAEIASFSSRAEATQGLLEVELGRERGRRMAAEEQAAQAMERLVVAAEALEDARARERQVKERAEDATQEGKKQAEEASRAREQGLRSLISALETQLASATKAAAAKEQDLLRRQDNEAVRLKAGFEKEFEAQMETARVLAERNTAEKDALRSQLQAQREDQRGAEQLVAELRAQAEELRTVSASEAERLRGEVRRLEGVVQDSAKREEVLQQEVAAARASAAAAQEAATGAEQRAAEQVSAAQKGARDQILAAQDRLSALKQKQGRVAAALAAKVAAAHVL